MKVYWIEIGLKRVHPREAGSNHVGLGSNRCDWTELTRVGFVLTRSVRPSPNSPAPPRASGRLRQRQRPATVRAAPPRRGESDGGSWVRRRRSYAAGELKVYNAWIRSSPATTERRRPEVKCWGGSPDGGGGAVGVRWPGER